MYVANQLNQQMVAVRPDDSSVVHADNDALVRTDEWKMTVPAFRHLSLTLRGEGLAASPESPRWVCREAPPPEPSRKEDGPAN